MEHEALIKKWLTGELSEEEQKLLEASEEYADLKKIWDHLDVAQPPQLDVSKELARFHATRQPKVVALRQWVAIAASLMLLAVVGVFLFRSLSATQITLVSEGLTTHYLPDSSSVVLNKGSELTYDPGTWTAAREVRLVGEGYFQVKRGSTFEVLTHQGTVQVLGTAFNVKQRTHFYEVVCFEGKVQVTSNGERHILLPGDGYRAGKAANQPYQTPPAAEPRWLSGQSTFERTPLSVVLEELEHQYDLKVIAEDINLENTFTGSFPNDNLTMALNAITVPSGYHYHITDNEVLITREED